MVRPGRRSGPRRAGDPGCRPCTGCKWRRPSTSTSEPPVLDLDEHVVADGAVDPRPLEQVRRHAHRPAARGCRRGRRRRPGSRRSRRARRASARRRSGCGRTASRSGSPAADRMPASWPACGRDDRPVAALVVARRSRARQVGVEGDRPGHRLGGHRRARCRRARRAPSACRSIASTSVGQRRRRSRTARPARRSPATGTALVPLGVDLEPAERRPLAGQPGLLVGGQRGHRVGQHRVVPVLHPGRAGVVGARR